MTETTGKRPWNAFATPAIGKLVRAAARVTKHGGSAFPGRIAERIDPGFLARTLAQLPLGVVLVSGTNGKTTTTRMVASMLSDLGLRVFTNPTGSNFTRGVVSALLERVSLGGRLDADIAVLELDEAYAVHFVRQVRPRYALLLNVMRDQLDRFGEIDNTARLLGHVAEATTGTVVLNREDPRIARLAELVRQPGANVRYFGLSDDLRSFFPSDDDMATTVAVEGAASATSKDTAPASSSAAQQLPADVTLTRVGDHEADFLFAGDQSSRPHTTTVKLEGVYNLYNAAAALAVVHAIKPDAPIDTLLAAVARVTPAFGRGEVIDVNGCPTELLLVKNPMGFRLSLASFPPSDTTDTMIVINDEYADGRDMSWLWDVDFTSLRGTGVRQVSGVRAWDMALRLGYDQVPVGAVDTDIDAALAAFLKPTSGASGTSGTSAAAPTSRHIYCTYTAMLKVRAALARIADVSDAGVGK
ncbi:MurT ligase domain-containing protein [Bifidobacterium amazonense]|uniref:Lipid II isoglutaminyl synthase (glutamine-hydrolyzing) subunit MurT n=1 Tax=Bifidobacterium amazonense TaxID=2809027 RepID=A0ABS9VXH9_9BIFI|nr:Mur ligase family protein [Bifidobacterium amazonense]MCH9276828.1 MurT ligase domain-containing protein [Bifidobacterium amazonense]